jgi:hypothetical protein
MVKQVTHVVGDRLGSRAISKIKDVPRVHLETVIIRARHLNDPNNSPFDCSSSGRDIVLEVLGVIEVPPWIPDSHPCRVLDQPRLLNRRATVPNLNNDGL